MQLPSSKSSMTAGVLAAIGASVCCVGPLVLLGLGVSGAWIGNLVAVEPFRPIFIAVTLLFSVLAYRKLYRRAEVCATDAPCAVMLESVITCPKCGFAKQEVMPTDACQYFYECAGCGTLLRPNAGDCCVFCSFGSVPCPPMQESRRGCCA